jgi:hypothetical protein
LPGSTNATDPEPKTPIEAATRDTFRVVAMAASRTVDESKSGQSRALALRLLKETFENDPEALLPILTDLARLPRSRVDELARLLQHTTLTQLIQTGHQIGSRMEFLSGLSTILFDRQIKSRLLERRQLHRILAHETWIFGEEWTLTGDDERLTKVLKKFLSKLGQDVELADLKEVRLEDGSDAIPDLVLGRRLQTNADSFEQLVVELKRPKHKLDDADVSQLRAYASAIVNDESFAQPNVTWDFWLVGNETTRTVDEQRRQPHLPYGVVQDTGTYRIVVKQWSELISDTEHRLKFVQNSLEYETSHDSGLAYLREKYPQYLPVVAAGPPAPRMRLRWMTLEQRRDVLSTATSVRHPRRASSGALGLSDCTATSSVDPRHPESKRRTRFHLTNVAQVRRVGRVGSDRDQDDAGDVGALQLGWLSAAWAAGHDPPAGAVGNRGKVPELSWGRRA